MAVGGRKREGRKSGWRKRERSRGRRKEKQKKVSPWTQGEAGIVVERLLDVTDECVYVYMCAC